jgi:hypothetical protein
MKYFINYASNGFFKSQEEGLRCAALFGFKTKGYTNSDIDNDFFQKNKEILLSKRGAGYWLWKPYIILDAFNSIEDGDYLVYMDSGARFVGDPTKYLESIDENGILAFSMVQKTSKWTKGDCFYMINSDNKKSFEEANQLQGTYMFFRKCDKSIAFVKEWLSFCETSLITDSPNEKMQNFPDFIEHRHDQAIFSLLAYNKGILNVPQIDQYCVEHGYGLDRKIVDRHGIRQ